MKKEITIENSEEPQEPKPSRKKDSPNDEQLRHKDFMEELDGIKHLIFLLARNTLLSPKENRILASKNIIEKPQETKPIPKPLIQPQLIYPKEKPKKSRKYLKILAFPFMFLVFAGITFGILSIFFTTDLTTKLLASLGAGTIILIIGLITAWILKILSKSSAPQSNLITNENSMGNFQERKQCPSCNSKLLKSDVLQEGNKYKQYFKCSNASCEFKEEIIFNRD
jgi:hypothetical protein